MRFGRTILSSSSLLLAGISASSVPARAAEQVDLLLVLSSDVSRSVDAAQIQTPARRLRGGADQPARGRGDPVEARTGSIAICFVEWSGVNSLKLVIDWTIVGDAASARAIGDQMIELPRSFADRTSISAGIDFSMAQLERSPFQAPRRTIDVAGDGTSNSGRDVAQARDEAVAKGVTINGLVILSEAPLPWNPERTNPPGGLDEYYRRNVTGGPGAFVMVAENHNSFGQAIVKMIAEIAWNAPPRRSVVMR